MSRTAIREAINTYLTNAGLPFLASVKSFPAKFTPEMEFYQGEDPGTQDGVLIYLYVESQRERRIALGGAHSGEKLVDYTFIHRNHVILPANPEWRGLRNPSILNCKSLGV